MAKSAIDAAIHGTITAAPRAAPAARPQAVATAIGENRSAIRLATSRPIASPPQKSERASVATPMGAASRNRTSQLETPVSYTHLRAHETVLDLVCRLLLEK